MKASKLDDIAGGIKKATSGFTNRYNDVVRTASEEIVSGVSQP